MSWCGGWGHKLILVGSDQMGEPCSTRAEVWHLHGPVLGAVSAPTCTVVSPLTPYPAVGIPESQILPRGKPPARVPQRLLGAEATVPWMGVGHEPHPALSALRPLPGTLLGVTNPGGLLDSGLPCPVWLVASLCMHPWPGLGPGPCKQHR